MSESKNNNQAIFHLLQMKYWVLFGDSEISFIGIMA